MTTTPLMSLVLPVDQGSTGVWDVLLDTIFGLIDGHDHTTGKGAKIPSAALKINADVSWSDAGTSRAITDIKALDFSPQAAAGMASLAGALFLNSADNELYYRTTAGTNVKLTAGAALNVAAFTGGIGGDYSAVGALVVFDDATDSYWFQQQVGASVRQYARMRSADVELFEYKANPAAGVPTNRVRLASPAALAASYTVTWPAAVPGSTRYVTMSSAGVLDTAPISVPYQHSILLAVLADVTATLPIGSSGGGTTPRLAFSTSVNDHVLPLVLPLGTLTAFEVRLNKASAAGTITAKLFEGQSAAGTGSQTQIGSTQSNGANNPGNITLGQSGLSLTMTAGRQYYIYLTGGGTTGDVAFSYSATVAPP